jgi:hypothetical protein
MVVDWSLIIGAAIGASIGLLGEVIGRRGAARQEQHRNQLDRERELLEREHQSTLTVVRAFHENAVGPLGDPDEYGIRPAMRLMLVLFYEHFAFRSPEIRKRLLQGSDILETCANQPGPGRMTIPAAVYVVRINLLRTLSAYQRGESPPSNTADWDALVAYSDSFVPAVRRRLSLAGIELDRFGPNAYLYE